MKPVIIITGASRGIGAATAIKAAAQGYAVCINYMHNDLAAQDIVTRIEQNGGSAIAVAADVSQEIEVVNLFNTVDQKLGVVTALVNNVGILEHKMRLDQMDMARLNRIFCTNITSHFLCAREAIKRMSTLYGGKGGAIVNVSSAASRLGSAGEYIGLSREVANENIRVNCVRPGFIYTNIHVSGGEPDRVQQLAPSLPMQRGGNPDEVANAIMWLISAEASYITGTFIDAAGGK